MIPLLFLFLMSKIDLKRTKLLLMVFFSNKYFYRYPIDTTPHITVYNFLWYGVNISTLNLLLLLFLFDREQIYHEFFTCYCKALLVSFVYLLVKYLLSEVINQFRSKTTKYKQLFVLESSYFTSLLLISLFFMSFAYLHLQILPVAFIATSSCLLIFYVLRAVLLLVNNKNLISSKLYYIILYLCTLELVPFVYLYKHYLV
ncbi:DUF4271 domain-containing protein [Ochrovirga pacifica]|uniref:DUF4271 domain-containing protein n=1 Tax=Ochrovirga pacifica TaxID=1042376 RepID=UPI00373FCD2D